MNHININHILGLLPSLEQRAKALENNISNLEHIISSIIDDIQQMKTDAGNTENDNNTDNPENENPFLINSFYFEKFYIYSLNGGTIEVKQLVFNDIPLSFSNIYTYDGSIIESESLITDNKYIYTTTYYQTICCNTTNKIINEEGFHISPGEFFIYDSTKNSIIKIIGSLINVGDKTVIFKNNEFVMVSNNQDKLYITNETYEIKDKPMYNGLYLLIEPKLYDLQYMRKIYQP